MYNVNKVRFTALIAVASMVFVSLTVSETRSQTPTRQKADLEALDWGIKHGKGQTPASMSQPDKWRLGDAWYNQPMFHKPGDLDWDRTITWQVMDRDKLMFVNKKYEGKHKDELVRMYNASSEEGFRAWLRYEHPEISPFYVGTADDTFKWGTGVIVAVAILAMLGSLALLATCSRSKAKDEQV